MKKIGFLIIPILVILSSSLLVPELLASGTNASTLIMISVGMIAVMFLLRPKKGPSKSAQQVLDDVMDEFSQDAFSGNEALEQKFLSAVKDIGNNLPKSAVSKLQKMAPLCTTDQQKYTVAKASAVVYRLTQDWKNAIREYNKAIILHPTDYLAYNIGECNQRLGNLDKARDSYEFAIELNPNNAQYPSSLGTICVAEGDYDAAIDYAQAALSIDDRFSQALATMSICYGLLNNAQLHKHYLDLAIGAGYKHEKIESTITALKKRKN